MDYSQLNYADQKRQILLDLNRFVIHSEIVHKNSKIVVKSTRSILNDIKLIKDYLADIQRGKDLFTICLKIFRLKKRLFKILPHPNNNSYNNQFANLTALIEFATDYIKPKQQPQRLNPALAYKRKTATA